MAIFYKASHSAGGARLLRSRVCERVARHYHVWAYGDNGTPSPTVLYRRAMRYWSRTPAYKALAMEALGGLVLVCQPQVRDD